MDESFASNRVLRASYVTALLESCWSTLWSSAWLLRINKEPQCHFFLGSTLQSTNFRGLVPTVVICRLTSSNDQVGWRADRRVAVLSPRQSSRKRIYAISTMIFPTFEQQTRCVCWKLLFLVTIAFSRHDIQLQAIFVYGSDRFAKHRIMRIWQTVIQAKSMQRKSRPQPDWLVIAIAASDETCV